MLKVLLADDEYLVRAAFANTIDWVSGGFAFVGAAANGVQALEMIATLRPDIVITDLTMPLMGGLELIDQAKQNGYGGEFIVLSCHNEFEYVKSALRLGVFDYILKLSMDMNELMDILERLKAKILQDNFVSPAVTLDEIQSGLSKNLDYRILLVGHDLEDDVEQLQQLEAAVLHSTRELQTKTVFIYKKHVAVLLWAEAYSLKASLSIVTAQSDKSFFMEIQSNTQEALGKPCWISVGKHVKGNHQVRASLLSALEAEGLRFFSQKECIFFHEDIQYMHSHSVTFASVFPQTTYVLAQGRLSELGDKICNEISALSLERRLSPQVIRMHLHELVARVKVSIPQQDELLDHDHYARVYSQISCSDFLEDIQSAIVFFIDCILEKLCAINENAIVRQAKQHVYANLSKDLRVMEVSRVLSVSSDYFSHLFRKETGIKFIDYVNQARIEVACRLLKNTDQKIYTIAQASGFENANYFVKVFKKCTGQTPMDFKNTLRNKTDEIL